ncbi:GNAT family N-acetyltransferase [Alkaliphilus sp. MSJ-5]|uniref:GNAT family N-acetyltransferase n=1 Tax=Alkaliphilus flagellatus TaxID=2841507 RepID=A0ABS6G1H1_9FIRM|nr:GNAT family N-acetyltransferase [Alkaliphilus flagellatus]MBU5676326.1 GNAT family N-acetyltransferase [Alkaliphilus flagellatus]
MNDIIIKKLSSDEKIPYDLLLLADPSIETINDYIYRGSCYAAYINNIIIGAYVMIRTRPLTLELVNIAVIEEYQGKGIGKILIFNAIDMAKKDKVKVLEVGTGNSSISQLALYQKCGFRIVGIDRDFFKKHYTDKIIENGIECVDMIRLSIDL